MDFHAHPNLMGKHSFLSPSNYHWINYDNDKLATTFMNSLAVEKGTQLHAFAAEAIRLGIKLAKSENTINKYVNDAIGYKMIPEQPLYFSDNAFGTADTISFRNNFLRIHDLKTGTSATSFHQLEIYAAYFCLEYHIDPMDIHMEFRIYQMNQVMVEEPDPNVIKMIMEKVIEFDKIINAIKAEGI